MLLANFVDPRPTWDAREHEYNSRENERCAYLQVARDLNQEPSIALATAALEELRACRKSWRDVRAPFDEAVGHMLDARAEIEFMREVEAAGSPDRNVALKNRENLIAAESKCAFYGKQVTQMAGACTGARERLSREANNAVIASVVEETRAFVKQCFEYKRATQIFKNAEEAGQRSNAERAAVWPISEEIARREFAKLYQAEKARRDNTGVRDPSTGRFIHDARYEESWLATPEELEKIFDRRRAGFEAEKRRVAAQVAALTGQLDTMGVSA